MSFKRRKVFALHYTMNCLHPKKLSLESDYQFNVTNAKLQINIIKLGLSSLTEVEIYEGESRSS